MPPSSPFSTAFPVCKPQEHQMGFMTICLIFSLLVVRTSIVKDLLCARHYSRQLTCIVTYCSGHHQNCPFYFKKWKDRFWELKQLPCIRVFLSCISYFLLCPNAWPKKGRREVVVFLLLLLLFVIVFSWLIVWGDMIHCDEGSVHAVSYMATGVWVCLLVWEDQGAEEMNANARLTSSCFLFFSTQSHSLWDGAIFMQDRSSPLS